MKYFNTSRTMVAVQVTNDSELGRREAWTV